MGGVPERFRTTDVSAESFWPQGARLIMVGGFAFGVDLNVADLDDFVA